MATPTPQDMDLVSQHSGLVKWLLAAAGSAVLGLVGWIFKRHDDEIAALKDKSHSPDTCPGAAELEAAKVDRTAFDHSMERLFDRLDSHRDEFLSQAKKDRDEVLGEVKSLREEMREGFNARPTREELRGASV